MADVAARARKTRGEPLPAVSLKAVRAVVAQIVAAVAPARVVLFGSRAEGTAGPDSDVDLLVVTRRRSRPGDSLRLRRGLHYAFSLDLILCDEQRLRRRVTAGDFFLRHAVENGIVLYEEADG